MSRQPRPSAAPGHLSDAFNHAAALHRMGRLAEAEPIYLAVLKSQPVHFNALCMLGILRAQQGRGEEAVRLLGKAATINPRSAFVHANRAGVLSELGRHAEALGSFDRALALEPQDTNLLIGRGNTLTSLRRHGDALISYERALTIDPTDADGWINRGNALRELRREAAALESYERAATLKPGSAEAHYNRGVILGNLKRRDDALASYARALALRPEFAEASCSQGVVLAELERYADALEAYDRALASRPDYADASYNRGRALWHLGRHEEALASYDRALALAPLHADAWCHRGVELERHNQPAAALDSYDRAIAIDPRHAEAWFDRGNALRSLGRLEDSLASFDRALTIDPDLVGPRQNRADLLYRLERTEMALDENLRAIALQPESAAAHFAAALCRLALGDFPAGWQEYEWRWRLFHPNLPPPYADAPLWLGVHDIIGKTVLLHAEQSLGDTLQFCRYAKLVSARGARVLLEVQPPLAPLLAGSLGAVEVLARGDAIPRFDLQCPLLSLPLACHTTPETIPAEMSYLSAPPERRAEWRDRLGERTGRRIGIVWSTEVGDDPDRQIELAPLLRALARDGIELHVAQPAITPLDRATLDANPAVRDHSSGLAGFVDIAALMAEMDLVISVDCAAAHLAGALGRPTWLLLGFHSEWRWLRQRTDSPWYPSLRLFRQPRRGDWVSVLDQVTAKEAKL